jgi:hypothetical protein
MRRPAFSRSGIPRNLQRNVGGPYQMPQEPRRARDRMNPRSNRNQAPASSAAHAEHTQEEAR